MRIYAKDQVCGFRFTRKAWGELRNFRPMAAPIAAGPWLFPTSEHLYQAAKFATHSDVQERIAKTPNAKAAAALGRTPGLSIDPGSNTQRVNVMRWVLRMKREANPLEINAVLVATRHRPIVEVSTHDAWWGARPIADHYEGRNVLGRLWMELRQQLRDGNAAALSGTWTERIHVGCLTGGIAGPGEILCRRFMIDWNAHIEEAKTDGLPRHIYAEGYGKLIQRMTDLAAKPDLPADARRNLSAMLTEHEKVLSTRSGLTQKLQEDKARPQLERTREELKKIEAALDRPGTEKERRELRRQKLELGKQYTRIKEAHKTENRAHTRDQGLSMKL